MSGSEFGVTDPMGLAALVVRNISNEAWGSRGYEVEAKRLRYDCVCEPPEAAPEAIPFVAAGPSRSVIDGQFAYQAKRKELRRLKGAAHSRAASRSRSYVAYWRRHQS